MARGSSSATATKVTVSGALATVEGMQKDVERVAELLAEMQKQLQVLVTVLKVLAPLDNVLAAMAQAQQPATSDARIPPAPKDEFAEVSSLGQGKDDDEERVSFL